MDNHYCTLDNIDVVLSKEILDPYNVKCQRAMQVGIDKTAREMVRETKQTANRDDGQWRGFPQHRPGGVYAKHIAWKGIGSGVRHQAIWYVRSPEYRLTHLLVHGHNLKVFGRPTGKRTDRFPWLNYARHDAEVNVVPNIVKELRKI